MSNNLIVACLGIIFSCVVHIGRSLQRMGIHSFDSLRDHVSGKKPKQKTSGKHTIYILGLILTNLSFIFVVLAGKFGTISFFTAMYGVGMLPMLLFTQFVMKEKTTVQNWIGIFVIILGCFFIGVAARNSEAADMGLVNAKYLIYTIIIIALITPVVINIGKKSGHIFKDAMAAGLIAGLIASLDPLLKATGQNYSNSGGFLPSNLPGWLFFMLSFLATTAALLITQYAYSRRVNASQFIPHFNVTFISMPIIIQTIILPGYFPGKLEIIGIITIIIGIIVFSEKELRSAGRSEISI
jgi:drug/metabolite transporter (DMT)-like permease